ncbi:hypothetical protein JANAI62_00190 [Jannaschia pagri]|uniref:EfeO-type cupredoxin-like domain-containing protein n=1 Tax=Jannaschia pagri TaxID=2829797 RepID=A0ABQ4NG48_9RHOB|nr:MULTISPECIES: cupredoxin family copper-binding protein [unclassified Jannaschia]GIT90499.1 hypothetical protein JANAI61_09570 [Jannaschia sp. AI_61]GIT93396.1 hypothetical protein JANAI62_00190 [Jannaschia sp. AI_62]
MAHTTRRQFMTKAAAATAGIAALTLAAPARADGHARTHQVAIKGFTFQPAQLTIQAGDTVTFVNEDGAPHTATANNRSFDTGRLTRGQSASLRFDQPGRYAYFCEIHPMMKALLVVE